MYIFYMGIVSYSNIMSQFWDHDIQWIMSMNCFYPEFCCLELSLWHAGDMKFSSNFAPLWKYIFSIPEMLIQCNNSQLYFSLCMRVKCVGSDFWMEFWLKENWKLAVHINVHTITRNIIIYIIICSSLEAKL
jgi:hypothetical protein